MWRTYWHRIYKRQRRRLMFNPLLYYSTISCIAESFPCIKTEVRSAYYSTIEPYLAIINHRIYNMDNYFTKIYVSLRRYFICLIYLSHILRLSPFSVRLYIIFLKEKVFSQKFQGYKLQNFYNKTKWKGMKKMKNKKEEYK